MSSLECPTICLRTSAGTSELASVEMKLGKHFDGLSRIAWTKATPPRCIEDCTQHFNCEVRCTWRFSPLEFRVSKPLNFKCRYACDRSSPPFLGERLKEPF